MIEVIKDHPYLTLFAFIVALQFVAFLVRGRCF
jgi:hypothetical protein